MATMEGESVFLDSSLLIAASVKLHPGNQAARAYLVKLAEQQVPTCISPQVCREFLVVLTRQPIEGRTISVEEGLAALDEWLQSCSVLDEDEEVVVELHRLVQRYQVKGKSIHDCNIVATMLTHDTRRLATRNARDFDRYDPEIVVDAVES